MRSPIAATWSCVLILLASCASHEPLIRQRLAEERRIRCELRKAAGEPFFKKGETCIEMRLAHE